MLLEMRGEMDPERVGTEPKRRKQYLVVAVTGEEARFHVLKSNIA